MDFLPKFYFNFFFVGYFIVFSVCASFAVFLLTLKKKSAATLHFGISLGFLAIFNTAYLVPYSIYEPWAAYHRWVTVGSILPAVLHFTQFLLRFPRCDHPRLTRYMMIIQWAVHIVICGVFIFSSSQTGVVFNAQGHYFDLDADSISSVQSAFILGYILLSAFTGIWRFTVRRGPQRWALLAQGFILFFVMMIPATLNSLSRDGRVSRELFQNSYAIFMVIGLFVMVVVFLNTTPDRTTFMSKIIGISLATFLLIMQILSYRTLSRRDADYDTLKKEEAGRVLLGGKAPEDMAWLRTYSLQTGKVQRQLGDAPTNIEKNRLLFAAWREGVAAGQISKRLSDDATNVWFMQLGGWMSAQTAGSDAEKFSQLESKLGVLKTRLTRLSWQNYHERAEKFLAKQTGSEQEVADYLRQEIRGAKTDGIQLRSSVVEKFLIPVKSGAREYREKNGKHFITFVWYDTATSTALEAGYDYLPYRVYASDAALDFFLMTLGGLILLVTVFPVFFYLALVDPLNALLSGVSKVNEGDLDAQVKVRVEDEIGTLARSFNNMTVSIREARQKLQGYAVELEEKVRERTLDLEQTLTQVQTLKQQQDGDYFLTSLMLNPLGSNKATSDLYKIDFLVKQKKQFDFKHWHAEIGGDICVADRITLKDENYIVILNADAMGKSMQGAGGAVVLGSAFHALLDRCRVSRSESNRFPENWIRDAFVELHKIFAVFDGSMLVSIFLGLIHEKSGAMFFTNAEHPWPVILRDGKADFLQTSVFFRKLGIIPGQGKYPWRELRDDTPFHVNTFQLHAGDILLLGSDGRDDLLLGAGNEKGRIINENEDTFRLLAEKTEGDLNKLYLELRNAGEFTDDLSLIRVETRIQGTYLSADDRDMLAGVTAAYKKNQYTQAVALSEGVSNAAEKAAARARIFFKVENYAHAIEEALLALIENPLKDDLLSILVRSYKKLGLHENALAWAERFRLRKPSHTANLLHLAHLYSLLKLDKDARHHAEEALRLDVTLTAAEQILKKLSPA